MAKPESCAKTYHDRDHPMGVTRIDFSTIETARLALRVFKAADAGPLHTLINDWRVCRTLAGVEYPYGMDKAETWIVETRNQFTSGTGCHVAITGHENGEEMLLGGVGIRLDRAVREGRLGYWVGARFWGHGVATEAAGRMARWAMANLELDRLTATVAVDNPASIAVLRRIGFRPAGEGTQEFVGRGERRVARFVAEREDLFGRVEISSVAEPGASAGTKPLLLVAACALIDTDGRVLLARRPEGKKMAGLWEFPGGKLAEGETPEAALIRELKEELEIDVTASCLAPFAFASHAYDNFHLLMPLYLCRRWRGTPRAVEGQTLAWVRPDRLAEYPMPPADKPLIPLLRDFL